MNRVASVSIDRMTQPVELMPIAQLEQAVTQRVGHQLRPGLETGGHLGIVEAPTENPIPEARPGVGLSLQLLNRLASQRLTVA